MSQSGPQRPDPAGSPPARALAPLLGAWLPSPLVSAEAPFDAVLDDLHESEEEAVVHAGEKRRTEFRAGRHCARRVLAQLGLAPVAIPQGSSRAPRWPAGVIGSISHSGDLTLGYAVAVGARSSALRALGVDIERERQLAENLWDRILTAPELRFLEALPSAERAHTALVMFSAKECVYKCQYPVLGQELDFVDVSIELDLARGQFAVRSQSAAVQALLAAPHALGQFRSVRGWLACVLTVQR